MNKLTQKNLLQALVFLILIWTLFSIDCAEREKSGPPTYSVSSQPVTLQSPKILLIFDSTDHYGMLGLKQTRIALASGKIPFDLFDLAQSADLSIISQYQTAAITTENLWELKPSIARQIKAFVENGGGLAILFRAWNSILAPVFGVTNTSEPPFVNHEQVVRFVTEFLPGSRDLVFSRSEVSNFAFTLNSQAIPIARTEEWPVVWLNHYGQGKVIYWNCSLLCAKVDRGFITRSITLLQPQSIVSIVNAGIFCLDDYPNSSLNFKNEPIKTEFDQTVSEFYTLRWYPDLIKLAQKYNLKYTSALIFNYNATNNPPYQFYDWLNGQIRLGGKEVKSSIWAAQNLDTETTELALHGYNHQSLLKENWSSKENMILAQKAALKRWEIDNLGQLPFSYIPPHNQYDSLGVQAICESWPAIKVIGGVYFGQFEIGGDREFGPEPWNPALYAIPRNTSGYILTDFDKRSLISLMVSGGIWSHFVHPDDVFPTGERYDHQMLGELGIEQLAWYGAPKNDGLFYQIDHWLEFVKKNFPWLRFLTLQEAHSEFIKFDQTQIGFKVEGENILVETNAIPSYFVLYLQPNQKAQAVAGCEIIYQNSIEFGAYAVCLARNYQMKIRLTAL